MSNYKQITKSLLALGAFQLRFFHCLCYFYSSCVFGSYSFNKLMSILAGEEIPRMRDVLIERMKCYDMLLMRDRLAFNMLMSILAGEEFPRKRDVHIERIWNLNLE